MKMNFKFKISHPPELRSDVSGQANLKFQEGYTLVELLAVTAILVIVSGMIAGILYSTLRSGNKSSVTNDVSQNGNYALSVISNTILTSNSVTQINGSNIQNCLMLGDGTYPTGTSIQFENSDNSLVTFSCSNNSIASTSGTTTIDLINTNAVKVDSSTCSFTCRQYNNDPYSIPIINISYTVSQKNANSTFENTASANFSTSVTMRNFSP